jgi:uncharacterized membrane protein
MELAYTIGIIISSIAGFLLARYIKTTKQTSEHLVCPLGHDCQSVVSGRFSRFLGIPVEKIGMAYYSIVSLFYILVIFLSLPEQVIFYGLLITGASFAFSLYLTLTQLLVLKKWCTLCLGSAALSFMIVVLSFLGFKASFVEFMFGYRDLLSWLYVGGVLLGAFVTTMHLRTFMKFLKDFAISKRESARLAMFSHTAWVAIGISLLAGIGLVLTDQYNEITGGSRFMIMAVITGILVVYEIVVNMYVGPHLVDIHFGDKPELDDHEHSYKRKLAFAFTAVGTVSWYVLLLLSVIPFYDMTSGGILLMYIIFVLIAVILSILAETIFYRKSVKNHSFIEPIETISEQE